MAEESFLSVRILVARELSFNCSESVVKVLGKAYNDLNLGSKVLDITSEIRMVGSGDGVGSGNSCDLPPNLAQKVACVASTPSTLFTSVRRRF